MNPPIVEINLHEFKQDPYPTLTNMRTDAPICYVPQLDATLLCLRNDIFMCEKMIDIFSSDQPGGLMTTLMGQNMMRKDGDAHVLERRQMQRSVSPRTVKEKWKQQFELDTKRVLDSIENLEKIDLVRDYAMPVSAHALRHITGLVNMSPEQLDSSSQGMINGIANYSGNASIQEHCTNATSLIDLSINEMLQVKSSLAKESMLSVLLAAGQPMNSIRANIKLAISGGQNEPRDAIAGTVWALLTHPHEFSKTMNGTASWLQAFEEYARWMSPIGMSPRRIAKAFSLKGFQFELESRAFLMFGSGNRDETIFDQPDIYNVERNTSKAISFGAGPHFCAGAAASRMLIGEVALPLLFDRFPNISLAGEAPFTGWAFRGPVSMPVQLNQ